MQCPGCGFENIPGTEQCCICSTPLTRKQAPGGMRPPRAKNRSLWQKIAWPLLSRRPLTRLNERLYMDEAHRRLDHHWLGIPQLRHLILSIIPGYAQAVVCGDRRTGILAFGGFVAALALTVVLYKTPISNTLFYSLVLFSAYCVALAAVTLRGDSASGFPRTSMLTGATLIILCIYLGIHFLLGLALSDNARIVTVLIDIPRNGLVRGDSVLVVGTPNYDWKRGDLVMATIRNRFGPDVPTFGPILGVRNDRVSITDKIYVNGRAVSEQIAEEEYPDMEEQPAQVVLKQAEFWIRPAAFAAGGYFQQYLLDAGVVRREDIWGRPIAVVGPPAHRRLINR